MTLDIMQVIKKRVSVRRFRPDPVPRELIMQLLEAAIWAPNAGNIQPWQFYVVTREDCRRCLATAALRQEFIASAPLTIVVCAEPERSARHYGDRGRYLYCLQDTAAAAQNILLAATALGLGTCWVGAFDEEQVRGCLNLPAHLRPVAIIPVGYPADETTRRTQRRSVEQVCHFV